MTVILRPLGVGYATDILLLENLPSQSLIEQANLQNITSKTFLSHWNLDLQSGYMTLIMVYVEICKSKSPCLLY